MTEMPDVITPKKDKFKYGSSRFLLSYHVNQLKKLLSSTNNIEISITNAMNMIGENTVLVVLATSEVIIRII